MYKNNIGDVDISEHKMHFIILWHHCCWWMCRGVRLEIGVRSGRCCVLRPSNTEKDLSSRCRVLAASLSRPCMKRICHGADTRACVYICAFASYAAAANAIFTAGDCISCAPSWASTQTRVTLVELKCKLKSFWQNIHYCSALPGDFKSST